MQARKNSRVQDPRISHRFLRAAARLISFATHVRAWRRLKTRFETKIEIGVETLSFRPLLPFIETLEILSPAENLNFQPVTLSSKRIHRFRRTA